VQLIYMSSKGKYIWPIREWVKKNERIDHISSISLTTL